MALEFTAVNLTKKERFDRLLEAAGGMNGALEAYRLATQRFRTTARDNAELSAQTKEAVASICAVLEEIDGDRSLIGKRGYVDFEMHLASTWLGRAANKATERMRRYRARKRAGIATVQRTTRKERAASTRDVCTPRESRDDAALRASLERNADWLGTIRRDDDASAQPIWHTRPHDDVFGK